MGVIMVKKHKSNESGFTLLEVVLAMVIIGIVIVPVMGLFSGSQIRYDRSTEETIAVNLAQQKMEEIVGGEMEEVIENPDSWIEFENYAGFFYQVDLTPPEENGPSDQDKLKLYKIDVRVQYQAGGKTQELALSTYWGDWSVEE
jgi:prepilin-type N-terminal cleavage/methylation domain-containing protein